ncbi:colony stimulating factor 3 (granulocyte) a [Labeo rohita]|uniref:Colony stimulating factor 3 (Granulocyte) a n=2 Tax=Labeo rohita TaxID=84645 RepID=A0A498NS95_LABRO|nr:colony stimulating factor 3 (granulocyte) a [Labeo rohita]
MNFQAALLVTLVGIVASAPISDKMDTIEHAHSLTNKILQDIVLTHEVWVDQKSMILGNRTTMEELGYLRDEFLKIPRAPVLQNISTISSMETCLAKIVEGLQLHLDLLKNVGNQITPTEQYKGLKADIRDLLHQIKKLQKQAGFDASDKQLQASMHDPPSEYYIQVAAHITLQQLHDFSSDVLRSILSIQSMMAP